MNYPLEKFLSFSSKHQIRLLYKNLREGRVSADRLKFYLENCHEKNVSRLAAGNLDSRAVEAVMAELERHLGQTVSDTQFLLNEGDGNKDASDSAETPVPLQVVLHNLRSAFNVGSVFRTGECLNIESILLSGYSPTPGRDPVKKTAMGTDEKVEWEQVAEDKLWEKVKYPVVAVETAKQSHSLFTFEFPPQVTLIFGNERFGLEDEVLQRADSVLSIPTFGWKNSLNVANAFSVVSYEYRRQWELRGGGRSQ